ncbi:MAG: hypothetical protein HY862_13275 [Chloroflexi bacterium]|nr:hypothetical protein [Chloroflexota bacterium]
MNYRFSAKLALLITVLITIAATSIHPAATVRAQSGLSDEQLALLERVVTAVTAVDDYTSYVSTENTTLAINGNVTLAGFTQNILQNQTLDKTTTYILGDNPNALIVATYTSESSQEAGKTVSYTVNAEARYVEETLYFNGSVTDGDATQVDLPEGWVTVDDVTTYDIFDSIGLDNLLERVGAVEQDPTKESPLKDLELLKKVVTNITVEETTLEDGSTANTFVLTIDLASLIANDPNAFGGDSSSTALFNAFEGQNVEATIVLDADDNPWSYNLTFGGNLVDADASTLSPSLAGATLTLDFSFSQSSELSQVNEEIEPVTAPEE